MSTKTPVKNALKHKSGTSHELLDGSTKKSLKSSSNENKKKITPPSAKLKKPAPNTTNKSFTTRSDPLEEMKQKIQMILQESNDKLTTISMQCSELDIETENSYSKAQEDYAKELDKIYTEKMNKISEIDEKYAYELYKLKELFNVNDSYNDSNKAYNTVQENRDKEMKAIEEEFKKKKKRLRMVI